MILSVIGDRYLQQISDATIIATTFGSWKQVILKIQ